MEKHTITLLILILFSINFSYSQNTDLKYYSIDDVCNLSSNKIIANNPEEIKKLTDCNFLRFDFNKFTIIGIKESSPGHFIPDINFRISKNIESKTINVVVLLSGGKTCNCRVVKPSYERMIYIDKIDEDYTYEFNIINIDD
jgi:hypothetical protein